MSTTDKILYFVFNRHNPLVQRGARYYYYDTDGNEYLDASSGAHNCVLGHTMPPRIACVLQEHAEKLSFACLAHFQNDSASRLADRLLALMPEFAATGFYQSGVDAVEAGIRCALQVAKTRHTAARTKVIGRQGAYHGLTWAARALGGWDRTLGGWDRTQQHFLQIERQDCFNCPFGLKYPSCGVKCASSLQELIEKEGPETIAAFVAIPGAVGPPPAEYWPRIRAICDQYGIMLVLDEVLEGLWRTGPAVAVKRWGVTPDVVATGKVLGAGFAPIFATLVTEPVRDTLAEGSKFWGGHTYSGHILSCEIALAVLDEIESRQLSSTGVESVARQLNAVLIRICEKVEGARMASCGALARLLVPCAVPEDTNAFYLELQRKLLSVGLVTWISSIQRNHIELYLGPPFIADAEFFHQLETRLGLFLQKLPLRKLDIQ